MLETTKAKRRLACEKWKMRNREHYLEQKRRLAVRPEYLAHRRDMYRRKVNDLRALGIVPKKRGRPKREDHPRSDNDNIFSTKENTKLV